MKQWEYRFIDITETGSFGRPDKPLGQNEINHLKKLGIEKQLHLLNDLGATGWELVSFVGPPLYSEGTVLMKREKFQKE